MNQSVIDQFNKDLLAKRAGTECQNTETFVQMAGYGMEDGEPRNSSRKEELKQMLGEEKTLSKTGSDSSPTKGNFMHGTEMNSDKSSTEIVSNESHFEDSKTLSGILKTERSSSVQELNKSSKLLVNLASSLLSGKIDDFGEVLVKPNISEVESALKLLEGARNIQKTKLDFLKFGRDLI